MNLAYRSILLLAGLVILLAISLCCNYFLIKRYRHAYRELSRVTLDPLGLEQAQASAAAVRGPKEGPLVLFYGDSRAAAWPAPDAASFVFANLGVNGQTSAQAALRYQADAALLHPDVVVLQVGINDLRVIPAAGEGAQAVIAATEANIQDVVAQATAGGATVVLTTIFPVQNPPWQDRMFWSKEVMTAVTAVNHFIPSLAGENVLVWDTYTLLADDKGELQNKYAADYLHLNAAGYLQLNDLLLTFLAQLS